MHVARQQRSVDHHSTHSDARAAIAAEVDHALCTSGFLMLINHAVPTALAAEVRREARRFRHVMT